MRHILARFSYIKKFHRLSYLVELTKHHHRAFLTVSAVTTAAPTRMHLLTYLLTYFRQL